jgi:hypothetical protein
MANSYLQGQRIRTTGEYRNVASGALVDPANVFFHSLNPNNVSITRQFGVDPNVIRDGLGQYHYDLLLDVAGDWYYGWSSTGTHEGINWTRVSACAPPSSLW